jgi:L-seryl-tRNA(Ser) seleniumtransferase
MLVALELFLQRDHQAVWRDWESRCQTISAAVKRFEDVKTEVYVPEIANAVPHLRISWNYDRRGVNPRQMAAKLREGEPSIEVNPGTGSQLVIGVWMMEPGEDQIVGRRIAEVLGNA